MRHKRMGRFSTGDAKVVVLNSDRQSSQIARTERATRIKLVVPRVSTKAPGSQSNGATCDEIDRCRWLPVSSHDTSRFCPIGTKRRTSKESPQEKWIVKFGFDRCMAAVYCGSVVHGGSQQSGGDSRRIQGQHRVRRARVRSARLSLTRFARIRILRP